MKKWLFISLIPIWVWGQRDSAKIIPEVQFSGFVDAFYSYDFNQPDDKRQSFLFNHNRHNNFNINLALIQMKMKHNKYRANIGFHSGTYVNDNYSLEPEALRMIYEANVGFSLTKNNNLWLDAGVFESHIGFESAISNQNHTLTRSLAAESSPYFLTGARLNWSSETWSISALITNGWQRIQSVKGNNLPSFGSKINYQPSEKWQLNWSTFLGTDDPDSTRRMRYFSNLYGIYKEEKWDLVVGFDFGLQQEFKNASFYNQWSTAVIVGQFKWTEKWKTSLRAEYFLDRGEVIIPSSTSVSGFETMATSINIDYQPDEPIMLRLEARWLGSPQRQFMGENGEVSNNIFVTLSLAAQLSR